MQIVTLDYLYGWLFHSGKMSNKMYIPTRKIGKVTWAFMKFGKTCSYETIQSAAVAKIKYNFDIRFVCLLNSN